MNISASRCIGCARCVSICPGGAISVEDKKAKIDHDLCFECGLCYRIGICPTSAFEKEENLPWPTSVKAILSDPLTECKETGVTGRGTEEMKTNDVTGRFGTGEVGICVDVGRPNVGTRLLEVEKLVIALMPTIKDIGTELEPKNPVSVFVQNKKTGEFFPELRNIRVMSAIIEFKIPIDRLVEVLGVLEKAGKEIDTVFSLGIISRVDENGRIPAREVLEGNGITVGERGKVNIGLGSKK